MIYLTLFLEFFKIGLFTFGGGYAMIPFVKDTVIKYEWLSEEAFYNFLGVCEATPGPIAVNMATFVGNSQAGILGAIVATLGVVLPSFIIILLIAIVLNHTLDKALTKNFLAGVRPVAVGLIISSGLILLLKNIGFNKLNTAFSLNNLIILVIISLLYFAYKKFAKRKISNPLFILCGAIIGLVICVIL